MTPSLDYSLLVPEFVLAGLFAAVLIVDLIISDSRKKWLAPITSAGLAISLVAVIIAFSTGVEGATAGGTFVVDEFGLAIKAILIASTIAVVLIGVPSVWKGEYLLMVLAGLFGAVLLVSARDLITFFIAFELVAVPTYLLVGWEKRSSQGHEAALRYFIVGVVTTAIMAYGLSFLYGVAGSTRFTAIAGEIDSPETKALAYIAFGLVLTGIAFKLAAVPVHFWAPDTYSGAPLPVAAFLAIVSKAAGLVALASLLGYVFLAVLDDLAIILWIVAAVTMTVGNLAALRQRNILRLLGWSSVAQSGFLLVPLALIGPYGSTYEEAFEAVVEYFLYYALATVAAFAVVKVALGRSEDRSINGLAGLFWRRPALALAMSAAMLSLAGVPPLGGWFAKYLILDVAVGAGTTASYALAVVVAINTAISLVYYALVVRQLWLPAEGQPDNSSVTQLSFGLRLILVLAPVFVVITGVLPGVVTSIGSASFLGQ